MAKIKINSGWSKEGGSTFSLMELCDLFNERGHDCTFYGPHPWHLNKCKGDLSHNFHFEKDDIVIGHFIHLPVRHPLPKKIVLSCHEKTIFDLKKLSEETKGFDEIRFISEDQKKWQHREGVVIPNSIRGVKDNGKNPQGVAGVIGTICPLKQTHVSVKRALEDGSKKVLIYGNCLDHLYLQNKIQPLLGEEVQIMGMEMDRQKIYDSVDCVYQSNSDALPEAFGRVRAECIRTGTSYHGNINATTKFELWDEDRIYQAWKEFLEL